MTIITDYADPCAVLPRIREAYYALLEGRRPEVIEFDAGNGEESVITIPHTDEGMELALDLMEHQVMAALIRGRTSASWVPILGVSSCRRPRRS
jgi:hypothetical protein